jgi:hypothetical protein
MLQLSLTVSDIDSANLATNSTGQQQCAQSGLTSSISIGAAANGPDAASLTAAQDPAPTTGAASACKVDGIGWIICPVTNMMAGLVDGAYAFVSSLLKVQPLVADTKGPNESVYGAWSVMRNFANIAFVIAFMIIIFSQLTSVGLNNYGIKKMLPRLIIAAILVNASFWICAIAVDISNILGSSINGLLQGIPVTEVKNDTTFTTGGAGGDPVSTGEGWLGITGLVLAGTGLGLGVLYGTLSALLPALLAALIAIATVFIVLTIRQALIILLIVISPLAFVAYLLPNTESLYKKWLGLFKTLLLMYPIIAMIFGASALASTIVMASAAGEYKVAIQIMGALVAIAPLALTPIVMKTAGGLLNRVGGFVNNPNRGPVDKLRKKAEGYRDRRQAIAGARRLDGTNMFNETSKRYGQSSSRLKRGIGKMAGAAGSVPGLNAASSKLATSSLNFDARNDNAKRALTEAQQDYVATKVSSDAKYAQSIAGPTGDVTKLQASALEAVEKRKADETRAQETLVKLHPDFKGDVNKAWAHALDTGNETLAKAVQNIMVSQQGTTGVDNFKKLIAKEEADPNSKMKGSLADTLRTNIAENHTGMKGTAADLDSWAHDVNKQALDTHTNNSTLWSGLSDAHIASQTPESIKAAGLSGGLDPARAKAILGNDRLNTTIKGTQKAEFETIANKAAAAAAAAQPVVNIPPQPTQAPTIQNQPAAPIILNVPHNAPPNANPGNYRTTPPPNTGGYGPTASGLYVPNGNQQPPAGPPRTPPNP